MVVPARAAEAPAKTIRSTNIMTTSSFRDVARLDVAVTPIKSASMTRDDIWRTLIKTTGSMIANATEYSEMTTLNSFGCIPKFDAMFGKIPTTDISAQPTMMTPTRRI